MKRLGEILPSKSEDEVKKQSHHLKTVFSREIKREEGSKVSGSGTNTVYSSQWKLYEQMAYLMGSDDVDPTISNLDTTEVNEHPPKS